MKFVVDHDYHCHSELSRCSKDPAQTPAFLLQNAQANGYRKICLTDHFWDEGVEGASPWYAAQNYAHVCQSLPLPQTEGVEFLFGVETEMTKDHVLAISPERYDKFDFIIIPVSHFHMIGFSLSEEEAATAEGRAHRFLEKLDALLAMPLPFHKIGLAHLVNNTLGGREKDSRQYCETMALIMGDRLVGLFEKAAKVGVGIELNTANLRFRNEEEKEGVLRFYRLAKQCGCKFYFGSDAHHPSGFDGQKALAECMVEWLGLTEDDKFHIQK